MPVASNGTVISAEMGGIQCKVAEQAQDAESPQRTWVHSRPRTQSIIEGRRRRRVTTTTNDETRSGEGQEAGEVTVVV